SGNLLSASVFAVQPWLDIDEMGFAAIAVANGDRELACRTAQALAEACWAERDAFMETELVPPAEAIERALRAPEGPLVRSDLADGTGAGSPGDATAVVEALLAADLPGPAYACIRDPEAAASAVAAGGGATVDLLAGGKLDNVYNNPVRLKGEVVFAGP